MILIQYCNRQGQGGVVRYLYVVYGLIHLSDRSCNYTLVCWSVLLWLIYLVPPHAIWIYQFRRGYYCWCVFGVGVSSNLGTLCVRWCSCSWEVNNNRPVCVGTTEEYVEPRRSTQMLYSEITLFNIRKWYKAITRVLISDLYIFGFDHSVCRRRTYICLPNLWWLSRRCGRRKGAKQMRFFDFWMLGKYLNIYMMFDSHGLVVQ